MVPRTGSLAGCSAAIAMCAATGALTASGSSSAHASLEAVARMMTVAAPIAVGLFALHRPPFERFGMLLLVAGFLWFLTTLANAENATLYSVGRVSQWGFETLLIYLLLAFPTGRLANRLDRFLVSVAVLLVLILYLPTALLVNSYPVPAPVMSCTVECPANAFILTGSEPAIVEDVLRPLRELITFALFTAVAVRLALRIRSASRLTRRTLAPVLTVACFRLAVFAGGFAGRRLRLDFSVLEASAWLLALTVPLAALAFLVGLLRWWVFIARATERLAARLRGHATPEDLRATLAAVFEDPSLAIVYWLSEGEGHWVDAHGQRLDPPSAAPGRAVTMIVDGDRRVAAIVHDAALANDTAFVDVATSYAVMTLDNQRLAAQASALLRDVRESRARILAAADDERRRVERDLHDGAQQRLIALRIELELAAERTSQGHADGAEGAAVLRRLGGDVEETLEEVRSLAHGIYPAPLADRGLVVGLRAAARRNALPTRVHAAGVKRYSREIESAAYFCCLEALQNATKHAAGASAAAIELSDNGSLRIQIRDDGAGFDPAKVAGGVGFTNMRDRVAAVDGELDIKSSPGRGTHVTFEIPLSANSAPNPIAD